MPRYTLDDAAALAPDALAQLRADFSPALVERAMEHQRARRLQCDTDRGRTTDRDGFRSQFVDWQESDAQVYAARPDQVFPDFFRNAVGNSCSRMARDLNP